MKETDFIKQNDNKWREFEREIDAQEKRPDKIARHYIDTIDDLSFARTHYPNRMVRSYLNGIAQILSLKIHKSRAARWEGIKKFWVVELPLVMYESRKQFALSFLILVLSMGIGVLSSVHDEEFATYILGKSYIETTLENIEKGDPMGVYKDAGQGDMFLKITLNNILVSAKTYILSLFFGAGTLLIIIYNGIMIGVFQYFFIERGLFVESFLTIWQHGVVEISCIVLAGTAGLVLAKGILFPGTYSRLNAFRFAGRKSLLIMLGLMPLLVYSGAVEAFVTRYTEMHWLIRLSTILLSLGFVLIYFVWYPRKVAGSKDITDQVDIYLQPIKASEFSFKAIEDNFSILWEAFRQLLLYRKTWLLTGIMLSVITTVIHLNPLYDILMPAENPGQNVGASTLWSFFHTDDHLVKFMANSLIVGSAIFIGNFNILRSVRTHHTPGLKANAGVLFPFAVFIGVLAAVCLSHSWLVFVFVILLPLIGFAPCIALIQNEGFFKSSSSAFSKGSRAYLKILGLMAVLLFMSAFLLLFLQSFLINLLYQLLTSLTSLGYQPYGYSALNVFIMSFALFSVYAVLFSALGLSYFSVREITSSEQLQSKIQKMFPLEEEEASQTSLLNRFKPLHK